MNQKTETNINETIEWIGKTADEGKAFIIEQAPLYAQEIVAWHFWGGIIGTIIGLLVLIASVVAINKGFKSRHRDYNHIISCSGFTTVWISSIFALAAMVTVIVCVPMFIKAKVAPRVIIVEHIKSHAH